MSLEIYEALKPKLEQYKYKPVEFAKDVFGVTLDEWQEEMLRNINDYQKIAVAGATGIGKSHGAALAIWWFITTKWEGDKFAKLICTSTDENTIKRGVWAQLAELYRKSPLMQLLFTMTAKSIYLKGAEKECFCLLKTTSARYSASGDAQAEGLAGVHSPWTLFFVDESSGVPKANIEALLGSCVGPQRKILMSFNPLRDDGFVYEIFNNKKYSDDWKKMNVSFYEVSRLANDPVLLAERERWKVQYGINSAYVQARIYGRFPTAATTDRVFSINEVNEARERNKDLIDDDTQPLMAGVDTSRFGCMDPVTEVLTDQGWLPISEVTTNMKALVLDGEEARWGRIHATHKIPFEGKLNLFDGHKINFCVTDSHRFIYRNDNREEWKMKAFKDLPPRCFIKDTNIWKGKNPKIKKFVNKYIDSLGRNVKREYEFDFHDWAFFLGWFVAEGSCYKTTGTKNSYMIEVSQFQGPKYEAIYSLLKRMGFGVGRKKTGLSFSNTKIGKHLIKHCKTGAKNKRVPKYIKESSHEIMRAFLNGFALGDGYFDPNGGINYNSTSKLLIDDIQEMLVKLGRSAKTRLECLAGVQVIIGNCHFIRKNDVLMTHEKAYARDSFIEKKRITKIDYSGFVYCISTETGTFMSRRKGCTMWSGNSDETVYYLRRGNKSLEMLCESQTTAPHIVARCIELAQKWTPEGKDPKKHTIFLIDEVGTGSGPVDYLLENGWIVAGVNNGSSPTMPDDYRILIDELWLEDGKDAIRECGIIDDDILAQQLLSRRYIFTGKAKQRRINTKDEMKAKKQDSPDRADAFILAFANPDKLHLRSHNIKSTIDFF